MENIEIIIIIIVICIILSSISVSVGIYFASRKETSTPTIGVITGVESPPEISRIEGQRVITGEKSVLTNDTCLSTNIDNLCSNSLRSDPYRFDTQDDGNVVIYNDNKPIWSSSTNGIGSRPYSLRMQDDGNLVVYDSTNKPIWASNTNGKGTSPYRLIMQSDGNGVIYDKDNSPIWATNTNGK